MTKRIRFSTRLFFVTVLLVAYLLAAVLVPARSARRTIDYLQSSGVSIHPRDESLLGVLAPQFVTLDVYITGELSDEQIVALNKLNNIKSFSWKEPEVKSLKTVLAQRNLEEISILSPPSGICDSLANCRSIKKISITGLGFVGLDLGELSHLSNLISLDLSYTGLNDKGMEAVATISSLQALKIEHTNVTDASAVYFSQLPLNSIDISETQISDASLPEISKLVELRSLNCRSTRISETGLIQHLKSPAKNTLCSLSVSSLTIASDGQCDLKLAFPGCDVWAPTTINLYDRYSP